MKIAAIDIGSNAVRLLIKKVVKEKGEIDSIKVSYTRVPVRLGEDVFSTGKISKEKQGQIIKTIKAFKHLMDVQSIKNFRACATSAMREARNKKDFVRTVVKETGIKLEVISGEEEANLIISNFVTQGLEKQSEYLYIDVGGGSTELSIIRKGKKGKGASFEIGTVRALEKKIRDDSWDDLRDYCVSIRKKYKDIKGIGTGGNINRIFKESRRKTFENISFKEIEQIKEYIQSFSMKDRIRLLKLKPDRADVIIPAAKIYLFIMKHTGIKDLTVPKIGLSDGIIYDLYERTKNGN